MHITGYQLKKFLKNSDITQDEAAKSLNVSRQTVNNWCKLAVLDDDIIHNVKTIYPNFLDESITVVKEPEIAYKSDIRLLIEQNTQLIKNNTTLVETINKLSEELISMNRDAKNAHAREDAGCANVG
jgi:transcriptional regulator with XRE-family HTH domain